MGVGKFRSSKNQKVGRREIPELEKSKSWASGNSARPNQVKMARREIPQAQIKLKRGVGKFRSPKKSKNGPSGNSASPNRVKMARREIPQPRKIKKTGVGKFRKIEKFYLHIDFLSWRQNANRLTLQTKKIKTKFHD